MSRIAVFAYGSLVGAESAARTLGHQPASIRPARLGGWRRRWSLVRDNLRSEKTFALVPGGELPPWMLGLNLEPAPEATPARAPNGALIDVDEDDLARLDRRELRYDRIEVTESVEAAGPARVFAYTARPGNFAAEPPQGAVILATYLAAVEAAFDAFGPGQLDLFRETTGPPPVPIVDGVLVRDQIPPGNPTDW